jgi:predicted amidohydrolase
VLRVAGIQHDVVWEDRDATLAAVAPLVRAAADGGAELVVLPELFAVGFSMATDRIAEPPDGPTVAWLAAQASTLRVWLCGSVPERAAGADRPANTFVAAGPDGELHRYAKRHPFTFAGEGEHYAAGDETLTFAIGGVRMSPAICYDLRFADQLWAQAPGTDCYVVVASWPASRARHWEALLTARAIENQAYVVGVNRVGTDGAGVRHAGGSCVVDPMGEVVAAAGDEVGIVTATVDPAVVAATRRRFPFLADRR